MTEDRLINPHLMPDDQGIDVAMRPLRLEDFVGQEKLRENLSIFISSAKARGKPLDHVLLYGPPGLGKTTLAQIVARELGVNFRSTSGPIISKAGDLAAILTNLQPMDVLFIDEIHRLNTVIEEVLYPAIEDFKLDLIIGEGPAARSIQIDLPPFTLVGATTRSGLITRPLRERFGIPLPLQFYEPHELQKIVSKNAQKLGINMSDEGALEIARRSRGTPRIAGRLLRRILDIATVYGHAVITKEVADHALQRLDVDQAGFDALDRKYLTLMLKNYGGGPVGVDTMAAVMAEQRDVVEEVIEPYLLQQGFIQRTPRGRQLTSLAYTHLGLEAPSDLQKDLFDDPA